MLPYNKNLKEIAKKLRAHPTKAEWCLWGKIRRNNLNYRFYRQKPIGDYIVDFYCPKARLIIEIDGGYHFTEVGKGNDKVRDEYMKSLGLVTTMFPNSEVINNTNKVVESLCKILLILLFQRRTNQRVKTNDPF